jgi:hypothetical protein
MKGSQHAIADQVVLLYISYCYSQVLLGGLD